MSYSSNPLAYPSETSPSEHVRKCERSKQEHNRQQHNQHSMLPVERRQTGDIEHHRQDETKPRGDISYQQPNIHTNISYPLQSITSHRVSQPDCSVPPVWSWENQNVHMYASYTRIYPDPVEKLFFRLYMCIYVYIYFNNSNNIEFKCTSVLFFILYILISVHFAYIMCTKPYLSVQKDFSIIQKFIHF